MTVPACTMLGTLGPAKLHGMQPSLILSALKLLLVWHVEMAALKKKEGHQQKIQTTVMNGEHRLIQRVEICNSTEKQSSLRLSEGSRFYLLL